MGRHEGDPSKSKKFSDISPNQRFRSHSHRIIAKQLDPFRLKKPEIFYENPWNYGTYNTESGKLARAETGDTSPFPSH